MTRHRQFEFLAGEYLKNEGFETEVTTDVADWGVDMLCLGVLNVLNLFKVINILHVFW